MFGFFDNPNRQYNQGVSDFDANNSFYAEFVNGRQALGTRFSTRRSSRVSLYTRKGVAMQPLYSLRRDISIAGTKSRYD